jgi:ketosteroid isomerase-like protein
MFRTIARGDFDSLGSFLADDVVMEIAGPAELPFVGRTQGANQVAGQIARNFSHFEDQQPDVESVVAQGDMVVLQARERGRLRASRRPYHIHWVQIYTFRDGKLKRFQEIFDSAPLLAAHLGG